MRLLLDTCAWGGTATELERLGHEVIWAGRWKEDPGDEAILAAAWRDSRVLVTLDKDFGELAIVKGLPHAGIIRIVGGSVTGHGQLVSRALETYGDDLLRGAIVTIEERRTRVRLAE